MVVNLKTKQLNIFQWNAQSIRNKWIALEQLLIQEKIHIAVISETWLESDFSLRLRGYNIYRQDRDDGYGGVAILIHSSVKSEAKHKPNCNPAIEILYVKIHNCDTVENIISIYCPPSARTTQSDWDQIFSLSNHKTILLGDFNGHHPNWSNKTDMRGSQIFNSILETNFITLNDARPTRVKLVNNILQQSSPDLTLVSSDIALKFKWNVTNESLGSDHLIIKISTVYDAHLSSVKKRNFKEANWDKYKKYLEKRFSELTLPNDFQEAYRLFLQCINQAADNHIPYIKINQNPNNNFKPKPYWNSTLSKAVAERRLALAKFRRNPTPNNLSIWQNKIRETQKLIRNAKNDTWRKFCSSVDETFSSNEMWRRMNWLKGYKSSKHCVNEDQVKNLLNNLTPDYVLPDHPTFYSYNPKLVSQISRQELDKNIKSSDTAPGCDDISFSMIKNLPDIGKNILLALYNKWLSYGFVSEPWREI